MRIVLFIIASIFSTLVAAQEVRDICPQAIPPGWVVVSSRACADCCGPGMTEKLTIRRIDDAQQGARVDMCPQETPRGWAVVGTRPCADCCGSTMGQMLTIEHVGSASGSGHHHHDDEDDEHRARQTPINPNPTQMEICSRQPIPYGWVIVSSRTCADCCGSTMSQMFTIKRVGN